MKQEAAVFRCMNSTEQWDREITLFHADSNIYLKDPPYWTVYE